MVRAGYLEQEQWYQPEKEPTRGDCFPSFSQSSAGQASTGTQGKSFLATGRGRVT